MKVYIQSAFDKSPINVNMYAAKEGFQQMGFEVVPFFYFSDLRECEKEDIVVGGVEVSRYYFDKRSIEVPYLNYPDELQSFLGRKVWKDTVENIMSLKNIKPFFVKPIREKRFTGFVYQENRDFLKFMNCNLTEELLCNEVVDFKREWRVFVKYGKIIDVRPYFGDWRVSYNSKVIEDCIEVYNEHSAPAAYAIDFGVTAEGKTLLIEVNDGYSVGCYGLPSLDYAKFLSARWSEIMSLKDKCDFQLESIKWFNRKG